jgi:hypothetical protein
MLTKILEGIVVSLLHLNVLTFSKNHFSFTTTAKFTYFDADYIFSGIQNLEELDLSENYFNIIKHSIDIDIVMV